MPPSIKSADPDIVGMSERNDQTSLVDTTERLRGDLELISYITSHDLRAPLRIITVFCEQLKANPVLADDETARKELQIIIRQSEHLRILLEGMLEYIRLETFPVKHASLDMNEVVNTAITALDEEIKAAGAEIICKTLPRIAGHRGRLTRLFVHLLDNALKFRGNHPLKVCISALPMGDKWEFCVEDNGIGIDGQYHYIIFTLFQRLHTAEAYPGVGVGLALSRKIVESHGGTLWVKSALGQGSRFYFTLPAAAL